jgi:hypothetical protein
LIGLREVNLLPDRVLEELAVGGQRAFGHGGGSKGGYSKRILLPVVVPLYRRRVSQRLSVDVGLEHRE